MVAAQSRFDCDLGQILAFLGPQVVKTPLGPYRQETHPLRAGALNRYPYAYLRNVLRRISTTPMSQVHTLTFRYWKPPPNSS